MTRQYAITGRSASDIATSVERGVAGGDLRVGSLLPPVRALAATLGVAPGTVAGAYGRLRDLGLVETGGRRGTRVRARPSVLPRSAAALPTPPGARDVSLGQPDPALLPRLDRHPQVLEGTRGYDLDRVEPGLASVARAALDADGVPAGAVQVTGGALDGMERVLGAWLRPGDRVAVEDPGWGNALDLLAALDLDPVAMPVDGEGPTVAGLQTALAGGARAVLITSRAQNPTGAAITARRATGLRAVLAAAPDVLVVEDDHCAELSAEPLHVVVGGTRRWAFLRSASKPYGPDLRLALLVADPATAARVAGRQRLGAGWVSTVLQRLLLALLTDPKTQRKVARAAKTYDARRTRLLAALAERGVSASGRTGLNVWVPVGDEASAAAQLLSRGWVPRLGSRSRLESPPGLRLTVAGLTPADVDALADAVAAALAPTQATGA